MKRLQIQFVLVSCLALFVAFGGSNLYIQTVGNASAFALSPNIFAASPGASCALPDGTSNGAIQQDGVTCCPSGPTNGLDKASGTCLFSKYINPIIQLISAVIGVAIVIGIVYGAIEYITSGGDPQRAASGRQRITNALLGLAAFILLYAFLQFIIPGGLAV
jgi:hypothetical protein